MHLYPQTSYTPVPATCVPARLEAFECNRATGLSSGLLLTELPPDCLATNILEETGLCRSRIGLKVLTPALSLQGYRLWILRTITKSCKSISVLEEENETSVDPAMTVSKTSLPACDAYHTTPRRQSCYNLQNSTTIHKQSFATFWNCSSSRSRPQQRLLTRPTTA